MKKDRVRITGKNAMYCASGIWTESDPFCMDIGDGELTDMDGDSYYVHLECAPDGQWHEDIVFEDEVVQFDAWPDAPHVMREDIRRIEKEAMAGAFGPKMPAKDGAGRYLEKQG